MASAFSQTEVCRAVCETCPGDKVGELGVVDYILLALVLVVSAGIGIYYIIKEYRMAHKATSEDILMGGRDMAIFPIAMSLMASFMSAITVLGTPTEMYQVNTAYWLAGLSMIPTCIVTNHVFLPFFHKLSFTSAYEYLEVRFSFAVRAWASVMFVVNMLLYMGVVLYAPSLALNAVTDLPLWACILTIGLVCTFYTALPWEQANLKFKKTCRFLSRALALYVSLPLTVILSTLVCLVGLVIFAAYSKCDPYLLDIVRARDQLLPLLVMDKLTVAPGLAGLFVACLFSASLRYVLKELGGLTGGAVVIGLGFLFSQLGQTVLQIMLSIFGMVGGPLLGLFICGIFFPYIEAKGALWGFLTSSFISFWMGIGATVVLPVPEVSGVSLSSCRNRDILDMKCRFGNVTDEFLAGLMNATTTTTAAAGVTMTTTTTTTMQGNTSSHPEPEYNGTDLWIYHVSYLWYALAAVVVHIVASHIISIGYSCYKRANGPEDVKGNLIHSMVDRVCCYWSLSCQRIDRTEEKEENFELQERHEPDPISTITNGDDMRKGRGQEAYTNHSYVTDYTDTPTTRM
ncbi:sodium-coupled monocarboxylate transporter 1 [Aplysia californica]|uniref:Sodium-coupled monocarboxylate transporter 1 n=1 Tax=Aplysia californica TaxID=6500 RepID=A0ABM0JWM5_APLCA|nr:sodium-coupled monocarboxylate transporter 1 [Aplysia californica]